MKFPRSTRIFAGQLDAAPWASVFFLLVMFQLLAGLIYTPGVRIQLPEVTGLPGTDRPTIAVALDANGRLFFENQLIEPAQLKTRLQQIAQKFTAPVVLVIRADKAASHESVLNLIQLARGAGIAEVLLAGLPRPFEPSRPAPPGP